jgi:hypothetical protein
MFYYITLYYIISYYILYYISTWGFPFRHGGTHSHPLFGDGICPMQQPRDFSRDLQEATRDLHVQSF